MAMTFHPVLKSSFNLLKLTDEGLQVCLVAMVMEEEA